MVGGPQRPAGPGGATAVQVTGRTISRIGFACDGRNEWEYSRPFTGRGGCSAAGAAAAACCEYEKGRAGTTGLLFESLGSHYTLVKGRGGDPSGAAAVEQVESRILWRTERGGLRPHRSS